MKEREILDKADKVLDDKGWCTGALVDDLGRHCALGAIGYAQFGEQFDTVAFFDPGRGYGMLRNDQDAVQAIHVLANQIRTSRGMLPITIEDGQVVSRHLIESDMKTVYQMNDNTSKTKIRSLLGAASKFMAARTATKKAANVVAAVKDWAPEVRHKKADPAFPNAVQAEELHANKESA